MTLNQVKADLQRAIEQNEEPCGTAKSLLATIEGMQAILRHPVRKEPVCDNDGRDSLCPACEAVSKLLSTIRRDWAGKAKTPTTTER